MTLSFDPSNLRCVGIAAFSILAPAASAFDIIAQLERDANANSGPGEYACTFCPNKATQASAHFNGGFPPPITPLVPPGMPTNSQILGDAFADLSTGVMRGNSFAASYGHTEQHQMRFVSLLRETIDIDVPPGLPAAQRFLTFIARVTASATATNRATASATYSLSVHGVRVTASRHHAEGWNTTSTNDPATDITTLEEGALVVGQNFVLRVPIPTGGVMVIESQLDGTSWAEGRLTTGVGISNVAGPAASSISMILPQGATYTSTSGVFLTASKTQAWRQLYFGASENSGPGADTADPDFDGMINRIEFATHTNPLSPTIPPINCALVGGNLEFTYTRAKAAVGEITFAVQWSDTLAAENWGTTGVVETIEADDGITQQIKATLPAGEDRRFVRLAVAAVAP